MLQPLQDIRVGTLIYCGDSTAPTVMLLAYQSPTNQVQTSDAVHTPSLENSPLVSSI